MATSIITPSLLSSIRTHPRLPPNTWYYIAGVTLSTINRPDEIPKVLRYALEKDANLDVNLSNSQHAPHQGSSKASEAEQQTTQIQALQIARRMREALIKSAPICGLPKAINALLSLKSATPPSLLDDPMGYSPTMRPVELYDMPSSQILHRGQGFFDRVYGKISKRVMGQMDRSGTEDLGVTARLMYGYILSNTNVLSAEESSYVLIAGLIPQDVNPQLKGHLKGAVNNGATVESVCAVRDIVIQICEASGMKTIGENAVGGWGWRGEVANL
ncbi:hypothetical protein L228DRAFT_245507 [Xylona heveae TC161]|uniref:Carboxymuconolactone decarboxylase-like domain-containing protein n=1 Tax=Xylona heveae (strain CBS 132557 / TC161) TaxID=1328760 RepID=A0A165I8P3_XYLHT|nr:hypothetical protein L228DRAFT_245507 [Xylona heveae TC161]KZF24545.1 hypothetical protein L228DRAFT_245507 [Xylona heveae TC161]